MPKPRPRRLTFADVFDLNSFLTEQSYDETRGLIQRLVNEGMAFRAFVHHRVQIHGVIDVFDKYVRCRRAVVELLP